MQTKLILAGNIQAIWHTREIGFISFPVTLTLKPSTWKENYLACRTWRIQNTDLQHHFNIALA